MRNPIQRARGRALNSLGVPRTPNLPSGRAFLQGQVRSLVPGSGTRRRSRVTGGDSLDAEELFDESGPGVEFVHGVLGIATLLLLVYLLMGACAYDPAEYKPKIDTCAERVVYQHTRLRDC